MLYICIVIKKYNGRSRFSELFKKSYNHERNKKINLA